MLRLEISRAYNGKTPRNGAEHIKLENAARKKRGLPPLTPAEERIIWHYRATGRMLRRVK